MRRGFDVLGRETVGDFKKLDFDLQVETVAADLKASFWHGDARVIASSTVKIYSYPTLLDL